MGKFTDDNYEHLPGYALGTHGSMVFSERTGIRTFLVPILRMYSLVVPILL